jgi:hypothetical protein
MHRLGPPSARIRLLTRWDNFRLGLRSVCIFLSHLLEPIHFLVLGHGRRQDRSDFEHRFVECGRCPERAVFRLIEAVGDYNFVFPQISDSQ